MSSSLIMCLAHMSLRWFSVIQILVSISIPLATNPQTNFHMAANSRLVVEKGSNCALLDFSAKK